MLGHLCQPLPFCIPFLTQTCFGTGLGAAAPCCQGASAHGAIAVGWLKRVGHVMSRSLPPAPVALSE